MRIILPIFLIFLISCIGTDVLDDPIVPEKFELASKEYSLLEGESATIDYKFLNQYGVSEDISPIWYITDNTIVKVDNGNTINALKAGQTTLKAKYGSIESDLILVTVVESSNDIAKIEIEIPTSTVIGIGDSIQLNAKALNINNEELNNITFNWSNDPSNLSSIDSNGLFIAKSEGSVSVRASAQNISSSPLSILIGSPKKTAILMGMNGYNASGTAELKFNSSSELILTLKEDFTTDFALGTFIYLANSTSGSQVKGSGLNLGEVTSAGLKEFNVSNISANTDLNTYKYVIVLCRPASITFGSGELL